jgi:hypothetical protein
MAISAIQKESQEVLNFVNFAIVTETLIQMQLEIATERQVNA